MDTKKFKIIPSAKAGLTSAESLLVVRDGISYLRVLGEEPTWSLMTATASEDDHSARVHSDRRRLIETAILLCHELGLSAHETKDRIGRDYVCICRIVRTEPSEDVRSELMQVVERFFELFDRQATPSTTSANEMVDLYEAISSNESGEDVYLSDGLWLGSDGSIHDRGR